MLPPSPGNPWHFRISEVVRPSFAFWAADCSGAEFRSGFWHYIPAFRHGGKAPPGYVPTTTSKPSTAEGFNASFLDGHVEWVPWPKFLAWVKGAPATYYRPYAWYGNGTY